MKHTYVKPIMITETFVTNEYISACFACLNMNSAKEVYKDDGDGVFNKETDTKMSNVGKMNDCDTNGTTSVAHYVTDTSKLSYAHIFFSNGSSVKAPILENAGHNSPHFGDPKSNMS